ncbi:MAG: Lrp/AsnC ligand binding domain-containing protein [Thermomicrobiales bacterium]
MKAYVLITVEVGRLADAQQHLRTAGIGEVDAVAGIYDLVAVVEADDPRRIGEIVIGTIQRTEGVLSTVTLMQLS